MIETENQIQANLSGWLALLASPTPTPGGGAVGALSATLGASLIEMVSSLTVDKKAYAQWEQRHREVIDEAGEFRAEGLRLAEEDALAFKGVIAAYKLGRGTDQEKAARNAAIQTALIAAAKPPMETGELALKVLELGKSILDNSNKMVISDIAVAAILAKAALQTSIVNIEINFAGIEDPSWRDNAESELRKFHQALADADQLIGTIRERIRS